MRTNVLARAACRTRPAALALAAAAMMLAAVAAPACKRLPSDGGGAKPPPPQAPPAPDLSGPLPAVRSYISWTNFAYRIGDSQVATPVADPWEHVRVDSYIQLNRGKMRAIEQTLSTFEVVSLKTKEGTATLAAKERWRYRYIALDSGLYASPEYTVRYDATYTVARQPDGKRWLVSRVEAKALDPVK